MVACDDVIERIVWDRCELLIELDRRKVDNLENNSVVHCVPLALKCPGPL